MPNTCTETEYETGLPNTSTNTGCTASKSEVPTMVTIATMAPALLVCLLLVRPNSVGAHVNNVGLSGLFAIATSDTHVRSADRLAVSIVATGNGSQWNASTGYWMGMFAEGASLEPAPSWIRNYCPPGGCAGTTPPYTATAPIKYWSIYPKAPGDAPGIWTFDVVVLNYRARVFFALFEDVLEPRLLARTGPVAVDRALCEPTGVHLARTNVSGQCRATWQSAEPTGAVRWRRQADTTWHIGASTPSTYTADALCGFPANVTFGFFDPGVIHTAVFECSSITGPVASQSQAL